MKKTIIAAAIFAAATNLSAESYSVENTYILDYGILKRLTYFEISSGDMPVDCPGNKIHIVDQYKSAMGAISIVINAAEENKQVDIEFFQRGPEKLCLLEELQITKNEESFNIHNISPLSYVFLDSHGRSVLAAAGCTSPIPPGLFYEFRQFGGVIGDGMYRESNMCVSKRSEFLDQTNWDYYADWRVCDSDQCTDWVSVTDQ